MYFCYSWFCNIMKENNLFDDFPEIDNKNLESVQKDFQHLHTSLQPTQSFKEQLVSRLEALSQYQKWQSFDFKKYTSWILAFTFLVSFIWYFYANFFNENTMKQGEQMEKVQVFSDMWTSRWVSEEMHIMSDERMSVGRMWAVDFWTTYSEEDRIWFSQACEDAEWFYISEDEMCILNMSDICDIRSYVTQSENACSVLFWGKSVESEILPNKGQ